MIRAFSTHSPLHQAAPPILEGFSGPSRIPSGDASRAPDLAGTTQEEGLIIYE